MFNIKEFLKWNITNNKLTGLSVDDIDRLSYRSTCQLALYILRNKVVNFIDVDINSKITSPICLYKLDIIKNSNRPVPILFEQLL